MYAKLAITSPTKDYICTAIKDAIKNGKFIQGQELKQEELAIAFGVSRMPIREALQILTAEGVLERMSNRHIRVAVKGRNKTKTGLNIPLMLVTKKRAEKKTSAKQAVVPHLNKIKLLPAREQVASLLRKSILSRKLVAGQELGLEQVAAYAGVSIMPVREALQILAADGLIKLRPNKGAVVLGITKEMVCDHYETRAVLEGEATAKAAEEGRDISYIEQIYEESCRSLQEGRFADYKDYNQSWHMAIWYACGNKKMISMLSALWNGLSMGYGVTEEDYARISIKEHGEIMKALRRHDCELARGKMREHLMRSMHNILTNFDKYIPPEQL